MQRNNTHLKVSAALAKKELRIFESRQDNGLPDTNQTYGYQSYWYVSISVNSVCLQQEFIAPSNIFDLINCYRYKFETDSVNNPGNKENSLNNWYWAVDRATQFIGECVNQPQYNTHYIEQIYRFLNEQRYYFLEHKLPFAHTATRPLTSPGKTFRERVLALRVSAFDLDKVISVYSFSFSLFNPKRNLSLRDYLLEMVAETASKSQQPKGSAILKLLEAEVIDRVALEKILGRHRHGFNFMHFGKTTGQTIFNAAETKIIPQPPYYRYS